MAHELEPQVPSAEKQSGVENSVEQKEKLQHLLDRAQDAHHEHKENEHTLHKQAEQEAISAKEIQGKIAETEKPKQFDNVYITRATKKAAYKKTLKHVQRQLPKREKAFSKVIHQPAVEKVSNVGAKTVARPSGLLAGGVCALLGSSIILYMAKHYGFRYNFFVFLLFLVGGFFVGLLIEMLWKGAQKATHH
jgi:hypothetical protein